MSLQDEVWTAVEQVRQRAPLVHNITNYVAMDVTANALLALGASPAMVHAEAEVAGFVAISQALVVNIGTLSPAWVQAMHLAVDAAVAGGTPWVLDPVGAGATAYRTGVARELAARHPAVVRGNASEVLALSGGEGRTRGVDSVDPTEAALVSARELARGWRCVVAVSGATDLVTDGTRLLKVRNGHEMMTRVTALGCTVTAVTGALLGVGLAPLLAAAGALAVVGLCGERAAERAEGPGSLRMHLLDELYTLDGATFLAGASIGEV
ncbi:MAG TPA: hydroxyethylthiazole kinase [Longimicrobiaceae bacterium]|nr:hydroxyethylthiazole kinase [Longimicrobiaceae bacterium]